MFQEEKKNDWMTPEEQSRSESAEQPNANNQVVEQAAKKRDIDPFLDQIESYY